jgi:hypothetical protein
MDNVTRSVLTGVGLVVLVAFAAGSQRRHSTSIDWDAGYTMTTPASPLVIDAGVAADPPMVPDPTTDYTTLDDAKLDGAKAFGKTILLHVWRGSTDATKVTFFTCGKLGSSGFLDATYTVDKRDLVKAISPTIPLRGECPRVVVKLTGKQDFTNELRGTLQEILDVTPKAPETLPPGVDYVSMDDIAIDGKKAAGKIALLTAYRGNTEEKKFTAYPCTNAGGLNFLYVNFTPEQKDMVKDLSTSVLTCQPIKVKLTTQQAYTSTWNAALIDVRKGE